MNDYFPLEKLRQAALTDEQQRRLYAMIEAVFNSAIEARSPRQRPPGKAGLKAEKGYYRLLYLEADFQAKVNSHAAADPDPPAYDWSHMTQIIRQLKDIPELQSEILAGIESALNRIASPSPG